MQTQRPHFYLEDVLFLLTEQIDSYAVGIEVAGVIGRKRHDDVDVRARRDDAIGRNTIKHLLTVIILDTC